MLGKKFSDPRLIKVAAERSVTIKTKAETQARKYLERECSGFILKDGYVVTCQHVHGGTYISVKVDHKEAKIVYEDKDFDLLLLQVETLSLPPLQFSDECEVGDEIFTFGNPDGVKNFFCPGYIGRISKRRIYTTAFGLPGASGSLVWHNTSGLPIGVVFEVRKIISKAYRFDEIRTFLDRYFSHGSNATNLSLNFER